MKKLLLTSVFLFWAVLVLSAQSLPSIRIVNNTGYTVYVIVVSSSDDDEWGNNILGNEVLENGEACTYQLPQPLNEVSVYDIAMEDEDGDVYFKWEVTLTNNAQIVFTVDDLEDD